MEVLLLAQRKAVGNAIWESVSNGWSTYCFLVLVNRVGIVAICGVASTGAD